MLTTVRPSTSRPCRSAGSSRSHGLAHHFVPARVLGRYESKWHQEQVLDPHSAWSNLIDQCDPCAAGIQETSWLHLLSVTPEGSKPLLPSGEKWSTAMYFGTKNGQFSARVRADGPAEALAAYAATPRSAVAAAMAAAGLVEAPAPAPAPPTVLYGFARRGDRVPVAVYRDGEKAVLAAKAVERIFALPADAAKAREGVAYIATRPRARRVVRVGVDELVDPRGVVRHGTWWVHADGASAPSSVLVDGNIHQAGSPAFQQAIKAAYHAAAARRAAVRREEAKHKLGL